MAGSAFRIGEHVINRVFVCVDSYSETGMSGRILHPKSARVVSFFDINRLLEEMEYFFDDISYPQAATAHRVFVEIREEKEQETTEESEKEDIHDIRGACATFVVQVQYRQNVSWQGRMEWVEKGEGSVFFSALEFMQLIHLALQPDDFPQQPLDDLYPVEE